jgi:hypothetical protein
MSEKDDRGGIRAALLRMVGLTESQEVESSDNNDDESSESLQQRVADLTGLVQDLQDLTKLLAMNQAQLASDMYTIYSQVKELAGGTHDSTESHSDSQTASFISTGKSPRKPRGGGSGGMVN